MTKPLSFLFARQSNRHCSGTGYDTSSAELVPSNETFAIATYKPVSNSTESEPLYLGLVPCCSPNEVFKIEGDCLFWCELPHDYLDDEDAFHECYRDNIPSPPGSEFSKGLMTIVRALEDDDDENDDENTEDSNDDNDDDGNDDYGSNDEDNGEGGGGNGENGDGDEAEGGEEGAEDGGNEGGDGESPAASVRPRLSAVLLLATLLGYFAVSV